MVYNILVVDDEQSIADLVELYLQNESYQVLNLSWSRSFRQLEKKSL